MVPLFVLDNQILQGPYGAPNRVRFLLDCLEDLRGSLRRIGGDLVVRRGDWTGETIRVATQAGAWAVFLAEDVSGYAATRRRRLAAECEHRRLRLTTFPGITVVPPGELRPAGGDHFRVFTPYWRAWRGAEWRQPATTPSRLWLPDGLRPGVLPSLGELVGGATSPDLPEGGEIAGRRRLDAWLRGQLERYDEQHDSLAAGRTSRLSPYLHFGCLSPLQVARRAARRPEGEAFVRQLCWRDFYHQVNAAFPALPRRDYRTRGDRWRRDGGALAAWREGRTGYPIVDAGMRQLMREGWMHNRARMIVASFLTRYLDVDWRVGAKHFLDLLVDGDVANNSGNWQWVAGIGNDTRPNRVLNPLRQASRFDPEGDYVRRYVPELESSGGRRSTRRGASTPGPRPAATRRRSSTRRRSRPLAAIKHDRTPRGIGTRRCNRDGGQSRRADHGNNLRMRT